MVGKYPYSSCKGQLWLIWRREGWDKLETWKRKKHEWILEWIREYKIWGNSKLTCQTKWKCWGTRGYSDIIIFAQQISNRIGIRISFSMSRLKTHTTQHQAFRRCYTDKWTMKKKFSLKRGNNHFFPGSPDFGGHYILLSREEVGTKSWGKYIKEIL